MTKKINGFTLLGRNAWVEKGFSKKYNFDYNIIISLSSKNAHVNAAASDWSQRSDLNRGPSDYEKVVHT